MRDLRNVPGREWRHWRHLDHTRCLFFLLVFLACSGPGMEAFRPHQVPIFFFRQHEMSVLDGGFFGHASVRWRGLFLCF